MHNYPPFEMTDDSEKAAFIEARRFANLVVSGPEGPLAAHLPMLLRRDADGGLLLEGHLARSNPLIGAATAGVRALAIFNGADAYVTPSFYPSKKIHGKSVPTWNYMAVHAAGPLETFNDAALLLEQLEGLTDTMERGLDAPWAVSDAPADYVAKLMNAITGVRIRVDALEGIAKLSQNHRENDRDGVLAGFSQSSDPGALALAAEMQRLNIATTKAS